MNEEIQLSIYYDNDTEKMKRIRVKDYQKLLADKNKAELAKFIYHRLHSRYINPFNLSDDDYKKQYKNGFSIMANCCLLIETLQSFKNGLGDSNGQSKRLFKEFFDTENNFSDLKNSSFYVNVRCGILHQGETTGGWKITREKKELLKNKTIDAVIFGEVLENSLKEYQILLTTEAWDSEIWDNFRTKMRRIIANTQE